MKKRWKGLCALGLVLCFALSNGTGYVGAAETDMGGDTALEDKMPPTGDLQEGMLSGADTMEKDTSATDNLEITYDDEDLEETWTEKNAVTIQCSQDEVQIEGKGASEKDGVITITSAGTYVFSGTLENGQILVDADKDDVVRLVLNGFSISCGDSAVIYGKQSEKIILTLAEGTSNTVTDGTQYQLAEGEDEPNAAIFSKDDLTINGAGRLTVDGQYEDAIRSKDDLMVISGTLVITAKEDGIQGKDSVVIKNGDITIEAGQDGVKANNDTDADKGYVYLEGGSLKIAAGDDGIHAESVLRIDGGTVTITESYEGLEGLAIAINGGTIHVTASDDGINSAGGSDSTDGEDFARGGFRGGMGGDMTVSGCYIHITGGRIFVNAEGDGIDSNGSFYVDGGTLLVCGPTNSGNGALDYAGTAQITGGTVIAVGGAGMAQGFSEGSSQCSLLAYYDGTQSAGTTLTLFDAKGSALVSFSPVKDYGSAVISTPNLKEGETYTLYAGTEVDGVDEDGFLADGEAKGGSEVLSLTLEGTASSSNQSGFGQMGKGFGGRRMDKGMPSVGEQEEMPQIGDGQEMPQMKDPRQAPEMGDQQGIPQGKDPQGMPSIGDPSMEGLGEAGPEAL